MKNLSNRPGKDINASWSTDGRLIVFESTRGNGTEDIYVMNADGSNVRRLTDDPAADMLPRWSPDGKWISFTSFRQVIRPDERIVQSRMPYLRGQAEAMGISISEEDLRIMAEPAIGGGGGRPTDVFVMKADGSELQHVVGGWSGGWSTCMAQR